jgi:7-keto-8-aminopelargonate synthetase-like enzyme
MVAQALAGNFSHALIDERSHPSLQDAASFLDCPVLKFKHREPLDFARTITRCGPGAKVIALTDGLFAFDGSVAPLKAYLKVLPHDGIILVDDAHAAGVIGANGKGSLEFERVSRRRVIQCITLSKAFGCYGGAVIGARKWRQLIIERSRIFAGSTPLPLPLANAARAAVKILANGATLRRRLFQNTAYVKNRLRDAGVVFPETPGPIVPIVPSTEREISALKRRLLAAGIYPPFLTYPGGPRDGYFRFVISSEHTKKQLQVLTAVLATAARFTK